MILKNSYIFIMINEGSMIGVCRCNELLLVSKKYHKIFKYTGIFFYMEGQSGCSSQVQGSLGRCFGCWLQVAGGCSSQVQINVKCLGGSPGWLHLAGGCSLQVIARAGWTVVDFLLNLLQDKNLQPNTIDGYHQPSPTRFGIFP